MLRSLTLRAFGTSEPQADDPNVIEKSDDPLVQELLAWNTELEGQLQKTKNEVLSLSQQLIALTGKQILLQDQRTQTEDRFLALQQRYIILEAETERLQRENKLLRLKLEFLQANDHQQQLYPSLPAE